LAYKAQFTRAIRSEMDAFVWKNWPSMWKVFSWLVILNRVWTTDRLDRRDWSNGKICPLCRSENNTMVHLLFKCPYAFRLWNMIRDWFGLQNSKTVSWVAPMMSKL
jgi:hypothetical protein